MNTQIFILIIYVLVIGLAQVFAVAPAQAEVAPTLADIEANEIQNAVTVTQLNERVSHINKFELAARSCQKQLNAHRLPVQCYIAYQIFEADSTLPRTLKNSLPSRESVDHQCRQAAQKLSTVISDEQLLAISDKICFSLVHRKLQILNYKLMGARL